MLFKYKILMIYGLLMLPHIAFSNSSECDGVICVFYFTLTNETPDITPKNYSPPILIHDESSLATDGATFWEKLPDYRLDHQGIASFIEKFGFSFFYAQLRYDIYEPSLMIKGPLVVWDNYGCTVDGKNLVQFNSEHYAYTVTTEKKYNGTQPECHIDYRYRIPGEAPYQVNLSILNNTGYKITAPEQSGTLADGLLFLGYNTQCTATGYNNCGKAAYEVISPGKWSPDFTFIAGEEDHILDAKLSYSIDDPELTDLHQVVVEIGNGEDVLDRCQARIDPPTFGKIVYQAQATRVGALDCQVSITRQVHNNAGIANTSETLPIADKK